MLVATSDHCNSISVFGQQVHYRGVFEQAAIALLSETDRFFGQLLIRDVIEDPLKNDLSGFCIRLYIRFVVDPDLTPIASPKSIIQFYALTCFNAFIDFVFHHFLIERMNAVLPEKGVFHKLVNGVPEDLFQLRA